MSLFHKLKLIIKPELIYKLNNLRSVTNVLIRSGDGVQKESVIIKKFTELNEAYVKFIGLDEVKRFQDRVIIVQEKLEKIQVHRRDIGKELNDIRKQLNRLQEQLHKVNRYEERQKFIDLTAEETEFIQKERDLSIKFEEYDKTEREIFTGLCSAVRDSHEKERAQAEYTKYFSIILSIVGTFVGAILTMFINTIKTRDLVTGIEHKVDEKMTKTNQELIQIDGKINELDIKLSQFIQTLQNTTPKIHKESKTVQTTPEIVINNTSEVIQNEIIHETNKSDEMPIILDESHENIENKEISKEDKHLTAAAFTLLGVIFVLRVILGY